MPSEGLPGCHPILHVVLLDILSLLPGKDSLTFQICVRILRELKLAIFVSLAHCSVGVRDSYCSDYNIDLLLLY